MRKNFLKNKIASLVVWTGILSALLIGGVAFLYLNDFLVTNQINQIIWGTVGSAQQSSLIFKNNQLFVKMLGTRTRVKEYMLDRTEARRAELLKIFSDYAKENQKYLAIYLLDTKGVGIISTDERFLGQDYSFRNYFKKALAGSPALEAGIGSTSKQFGYYFSHPVLDDQGTVLAVMVVKINASDIESYLFSGKLAESGTIMLVNRFGVIIASNNKERVLKSLGPLSAEELTAINQDESFYNQEIIPLQYEEIQRNIRNYQRVTVTKLYDEEDGDSELVSVSKIAGLPFYLVFENRLGNLAATVLTLVSVVFVMILLGILLELVIIYYFLSIFLSPLKKLYEFSKKISKGEFSQKIILKTNDEFGELADYFNKMVDSLNDMYKNLDDKVQDKTKDVEAKSRQLSEQKKAILNVLEDAETQKDQVESLARDLEKFKLAVEGVSDHIIIADKDGIILFANHAVEEITGFSPQEIIGKKVGTKELWGGEMDKAFYEKLWKTIKIDKKPLVSEINNHRKNGEKYIAKASISPILDKNGDVAFFVAIERDITKEKMVDKAKSEFVSLASHQLRTPLSAIKWTLEALSQDEGLTAKHKERIEDVHTSNERLISLVNDLLNVSHIEEGKIVIKKEPVELTKLINTAMEVLKVNADKKQQTLRFVCEAPITRANVDVLRFNEAFTNLVSNAINYAPEGQIIDIKISDKDKDYVLAIHNNEPIIPLIDQKSLFTKFYRGTNIQIINTTGSGLGLFIAKAAVEENGGKIWFESKAGVGTTFFFTVPKK
jgi:PAS domain S-box-containing protein